MQRSGLHPSRYLEQQQVQLDARRFLFGLAWKNLNLVLYLLQGHHGYSPIQNTQFEPVANKFSVEFA